MSLPEASQAVAYLVKSTKSNFQEVFNMVKDYDFRDTNGTLQSNPSPTDDNVERALSLLRKKGISTSSFLAKWNPTCYNLQDNYFEWDWFNDEQPNLNAVQSQEDLNHREQEAWDDDSQNTLILSLTTSTAKSLHWKGIALRWHISHTEISEIPHDISGEGILRITLNKGVTEEPWAGITLPRKGIEYPDGLDRITQSYRPWAITDDGSLESAMWQCAREGIRKAASFGKKTFTVIFDPITTNPLWGELLLSAMALGGIYGEDLENNVPAQLWSQANSETKGYQGGDPDSFQYQSLARRINDLAWGMNMVK